MSGTSSSSEGSSSKSTPPSNAASSKRKDRSPDRSSDSNKGSHTLQTLLPTVVSVNVPTPVDIPMSRCFSWQKTTPRSQMEKRHNVVTVCWLQFPPRTQKKVPPMFQMPKSSSTTPQSSTKAPLPTSDSGKESATGHKGEEATVEDTPAPTEIPFLRNTILAIHVHNNTPDFPPLSFQSARYPNGVLRGVVMHPPVELKETTIGFEWRDGQFSAPPSMYLV